MATYINGYYRFYGIPTFCLTSTSYISDRNMICVVVGTRSDCRNEVKVHIVPDCHNEVKVHIEPDCRNEVKVHIVSDCSWKVNFQIVIDCRNELKYRIKDMTR